MGWRLRCWLAKAIGLRHEFVDGNGRRHVHDRTLPGKCVCRLTEFEKRQMLKRIGFSPAEISKAFKIAGRRTETQA